MLFFSCFLLALALFQPVESQDFVPGYEVFSDSLDATLAAIFNKNLDTCTLVHAHKIVFVRALSKKTWHWEPSFTIRLGACLGMEGPWN
jgi:hypothetical protein